MKEDYSKLDAFLDMYHQIVLRNISSLGPNDNFCDDIACDECQLSGTKFCDGFDDAKEMIVSYVNKYHPELLL